jgi:pimeloyl-ACP methyl ester carboxylesterase
VERDRAGGVPVGSKRAALVGVNEGGPMAILFAATYPERTSALVLVNTFARLLRHVDYGPGYPADRVPIFLARFKEWWGTGKNVDLVAPSVAHDERFRRWYGRYDRSAMGPGAATAMYAATAFETDVRQVLPAIRVPTGLGRRIGAQVSRTRDARPQGRPGRMAPVRRGAVTSEDWAMARVER